MDSVPVCTHLCGPGKTEAFLYGLFLSDTMWTHSAAFPLVKDLQGAVHPALKISRKEIIFDTSALFSKLRRKQIIGSNC